VQEAGLYDPQRLSSVRGLHREEAAFCVFQGPPMCNAQKVIEKERRTGGERGGVEEHGG